MVRTVPLVTLDGANRKLAAKRAPVATRTVARPRDNRRLDPSGIASLNSGGAVISPGDVTSVAECNARATRSQAVISVAVLLHAVVRHVQLDTLGAARTFLI
jgi:hypothetical protein